MVKYKYNKLIPLAKRAIPITFYTLLVVFLIFYLKSVDFSKLKSVEIVWSYMLIAGVIGLFNRFWAIFIWFVLLKDLDAKDLHKSRGQLIYVYAKSWLGRYIPGTAPWILGKIYFASKHGVSKSKLAVSSLLEGALQVSVVMAVSFMLLIFDKRLDVVDARLKIAMIGIILVCLTVITPPIFNRLLAKTYKIMKKKTLDKRHLPDVRTIAKGSSLFTVSALFSGIALFFIAKAVYPSLQYHDMLFVMGVGNLAGAVSMLAIFAPSGIGVREGIQLTLLSIIMPTEFALLVTITTRLWGVVMDFCFFGIAKIINYRSPKQV